MDIGWKIVSAGSAVAAGLLANKILDVGWKLVTGHKPPGDDDDSPPSLTEIIVFAAVSGAVVGLSRQLAQTGAAKWYGGPVEKKAT